MATVPGVQLANIDDLESVVKTSFPLTASVCQEVEAIVQQEFEDFCRWLETRRCAPVIQALHNKAESIYQAEVERTLRRLGPLTPRQEKTVQAMGKAIACKLLHEPTVRLRELAPDEEFPAYLELIQDLYGIQ
jgi:glutamyl-tRNA reductase